jgi:hypothetical protein
MKKRPTRMFHFTLSKERIISKTLKNDGQMNEGNII